MHYGSGILTKQLICSHSQPPPVTRVKEGDHPLITDFDEADLKISCCMQSHIAAKFLSLCQSAKCLRKPRNSMCSQCAHRDSLLKTQWILGRLSTSLLIDVPCLHLTRPHRLHSDHRETQRELQNDLNIKRHEVARTFSVKSTVRGKIQHGIGPRLGTSTALVTYISAVPLHAAGLPSVGTLRRCR